MGQIATVEGRFEEAEATYKRIIEHNPKMTKRVGGAGPHPQDDERRRRVVEGRGRRSQPAQFTRWKRRISRFSMGKFCDDVQDFPEGIPEFQTRQRAIEDCGARNMTPSARSQFIDDSIRVYSRESISNIGVPGSASAKPVFVVGMPRSGTSLAEQILASHPAVYGAGELGFLDILLL